ncbi:hypothetical protein [Litorimonas haliclonae]|uniref:[protein-PII] uridylyltransferase family protein n=1 Tax=Litorimonas haliclonae TaxID=2081977 RepID=UPI0039EF8AF9
MERLSHSPYLSGLWEQLGEPTESLEALTSLTQSAASAEDLQNLKNRFALRWAIDNFSGNIDFDALGKFQSRFADATIEAALRLAWKDTAKRFKLKSEYPKGLFVLGLGKLGGDDLNFSSDIDLIGFYDSAVLPVPENMGQNFVVNHCLKGLTQILFPRNAPQHIWRVDWRLRPESSGTGLALSTSKAEKFYFFRALPWHRLALMKARIVAGDKEVGDTFIESLAPFIWRQNLDFRALDDLAELKTRINTEHPGLAQERRAVAPITEDASGFNLKLGAGGIREIEFLANARQLVWGGKQAELQTTNTRQALQELAALNHLSQKEADTLCAHYATLRQIENAVQMRLNEQTHKIPNSEEDQAALLALLDYASFSDLNEEIFDIRCFVNERFKKLFEAETTSPTTPLATYQTELSTVGKGIAESWLSGFDDHGLPQSLKGRYRGLGKRLLNRVILSIADTNMALIRVDAFLRSISRSAQYFDLLERHEGLLDTLITPLLHSPHMTSILEQSPHIIDVFLTPRQSLEENAQTVLAEPDYGLRLDRLRRFVNEHIFAYYHGFMEKSDSLQQLQKNLTALAQTTLETSITIVKDELELDQINMMVLGLGKMGTSTMAPKSDLDLVFIFTDETDSELASQVVRRLRTTLTTPLKEGIAYELDMRLRPSGRSGPPGVKFSSFETHHLTRAHTWEHIALAHARVVAGNEALGRDVSDLCRRILTKPRDETQFLQDARIMWQRIDEQRIIETPHDHFNAKLRPGGLMQAQYIQACRKVLGQPSYPQLEEAIKFWQYQQVWERLLGLKLESFERVADRFKIGVFKEKGESLSPIEYADRSEVHAASVLRAMDDLFNGIPPPKNDDSQAVLWQST